MTRCPYCGEEKKIIKTFAFGDSGNSILYMCKNCNHYYERQVEIENNKNSN